MNSVFHPPGKNPFQLPPLPQAHYVPSPSKEILDRSITLTPQKVKHRHEYSIPPEVYTPEQYSIHEDESSVKKPPLPTQDDLVKDLQEYLNDSWNSLQFCEQWPSKESIVREDSNPIQVTNDITMPTSSRPLTSTARSGKGKPLVSTTRDKPLQIKTSFASDRNVSLSDSQRSSNIQLRLNRFRYGDPKPPEERKKERTRLPTPSSTLTRQNQSLAGKTKSHSRDVGASSFSQIKSSGPNSSHGNKVDSQEPEISKISGRNVLGSDLSANSPLLKPSSYMEGSSKAADTSVSTLNSKLERLLQESTSVMSSPEPQSSVRSSLEKSASLRVSSMNTTQSSDLEMSTKFVPYQQSTKPQVDELPRKMIWQKENLQPSPGFPSPQKTRREDDILYQWRLRRKLESARKDVEQNKGPSAQGSYPSYTPRYSTEAEKPFSPNYPKSSYHAPEPTVPPIQSHPLSCNCGHGSQLHKVTPPTDDVGLSPGPPPKPELKSVAVGIVPMISCETQTGKSLIFSDEDITSSSDGGMSQQKPDNAAILRPALQRSASTGSFPHTSTPASTVSFHRVKIVEAELENSPQTTKGSPQHSRNFSPVSAKTDATTIWNSVDNSKKSVDGRSPASSVRTSEVRFASDSDVSSPTANVVKQVIGSRLFNTSQTPSSTSAVSRLKKKKQVETTRTETPEQLNGSYTTPEDTENSSESDKESKAMSSEAENEVTEPKEPEPLKPATPPKSVPESPRASSPSVSSKDFEQDAISIHSADGDASDIEPGPNEMFEKILEDLENNEDCSHNGTVLRNLRIQKDQLLQEFRSIEKQIEESDIFEPPEKE